MSSFPFLQPPSLLPLPPPHYYSLTVHIAKRKDFLGFTQPFPSRTVVTSGGISKEGSIRGQSTTGLWWIKIRMATKASYNAHRTALHQADTQSKMSKWVGETFVPKPMQWGNAWFSCSAVRGIASCCGSGVFSRQLVWRHKDRAEFSSGQGPAWCPELSTGPAVRPEPFTDHLPGLEPKSTQSLESSAKD